MQMPIIQLASYLLVDFSLCSSPMEKKNYDCAAVEFVRDAILAVMPATRFITLLFSKGKSFS